MKGKQATEAKQRQYAGKDEDALTEPLEAAPTTATTKSSLFIYTILIREFYRIKSLDDEVGGGISVSAPDGPKIRLIIITISIAVRCLASEFHAAPLSAYAAQQWRLHPIRHADHAYS